LLQKGETMSALEYEQWRNEHMWDPSRGKSLVIERNLAPAAWLEPLLSPGSFEVRMTAPQGFEAYARIFFPFVEWTEDANGNHVEKHIRWQDLAQKNGWTAHALMEQETVSRISDDEIDFREPRSNLAPEQLEALLPILTRQRKPDVARSSLVRDLEGSPRLDADSTHALLAQLASDGLIAGDDAVHLTEDGRVFFESLRDHVLGATVNLLGQFDVSDVETTVRTCKAIMQRAQEEAESAA
jgi:hypothetical protein